MSPHFLAELRRTFAEHPDQPAICHRQSTITFGQLDQHARRIAGHLQRLGVEPGDRVVIHTPEKLPFLLAHLGALYAGAVTLPLNPRFTREEMRYYLKDSEPKAAVSGAEQLQTIQELQSEMSLSLSVVSDQSVVEVESGTFRDVNVAADAPCLMIYSSGTTGWPKGVVHSHANLASALRSLQQCWQVTPDDAIVNVLPLFHVHGLCFATQMTLLAGASVHIEDSFDAVGTLAAIGRGTVFMAVPTIYYRLLERPEFKEAARSWNNIRLFTCGSAPIRPEVLPDLQAILGRPIINRYGMSEAHVITSLPLDGPWPIGSVGLPIDGIEMRVVDEGGKQVPAETVGAVQIRGPNLFGEYWRKPDATRAAFASGWFDTGDLGRQDQAGFLTLMGRKNDLIITNGYNVYPQVVERVVNECPGVKESAVVGVPDERRGERVVVAVVLDDDALDEAGLRAYWTDRLVDYQRPHSVVFLEALPRNTMGKVLRRELREQVQNQS